jgi:hypothetical protein
VRLDRALTGCSPARARFCVRSRCHLMCTYVYASGFGRAATRLSWPHRNATISRSKSRRRTPSLPSRRAPSRARSTTRPARPEEGRAAAVAAAAARGRRAQRSANQGAFAFSNPVACLRAPWRCSSTAFVAFDDSTATVSLSGYAATLQQECDRSAVEQYSCTLVCTAIVRTALYDHLVVEPATSDGLMTSFVI